MSTPEEKWAGRVSDFITIGEASRRGGVAASALRYYED